MLCVRFSCTPVNRIDLYNELGDAIGRSSAFCATILLTGVAKGPTLCVGCFATRVLTRVTKMFFCTIHMCRISTDAARRSFCNMCADARTNNPKNTEH